jgi:hypothetical protein
MMTLSEQQELKAILGDIFGSSNAAHWEMNEEVKEVFNKMLADNMKCSKLIDMVPRPAGWMPGQTYLPKEVISAIYRLLTHDKRHIYWLCSEPMKAKYRSQFEMASLGVLH